MTLHGNCSTTVEDKDVEPRTLYSYCNSVVLVHLPAILVRVSFSVMRHHDNGNYYKGKIFNWGDLLTVSEVQAILIMVESMVACRQMWYWLHLDQKATAIRLSY